MNFIMVDVITSFDGYLDLVTKGHGNRFVNKVVSGEGFVLILQLLLLSSGRWIIKQMLGLTCYDTI